ncbi:MAG: ribonuclease E activity regulator RraA [Epsilonproteobacteria bacterium]|nr:ribonuclease E activity regulator RraA [Campylobacterota bacterium]
MDFYTADICDTHGDEVQVLYPLFTNYGKAVKCYGTIETIKLEEDNSDLITLLKTEVENKIAIVDVSGDFCAVVGENLMNFASQNGWRAIIINGYVRDIEATAKIDVGLFALGTCPQKSIHKAEAEQNIPLEFAGVTFTPGDHLYSDEDGIILTTKRVH